MQERIWGRRSLVWYFGNANFEEPGTSKEQTQIVIHQHEAFREEIKAKS